MDIRADGRLWVFPDGTRLPVFGGGDDFADLEEKKSDELESRLSTLVKESEAMAGRATSGQLGQDERKTLRSNVTEIGVINEILALRAGDKDAIEVVNAAKKAEEDRVAARNAALEQNRPAIHGRTPEELAQQYQTPGEIYVESDAHKQWLQMFPSGGPSEGSAFRGAAVVVPQLRAAMGFEDPTEKLKRVLAARAPGIITAADSVAGDLIRPQYLGLLEPGLVRPLTIRQLVTTIPTETDAIEYAKEISREAAALPVAEATGSGGASGLKPEGGLVFDIVSDTIKTIAVWVAATKRVLSDARQLRAYIDAYLRTDLALELEDQMISGAGTGENFRGILNTVGIQVQAAPGAGESVFDTLRRAKRLVQVNGRTNPTAAVLNPVDSEKIDLLKVNNEVNHYAGAGPFSAVAPPLWGMPRVESEAVPAGTALVGDFTKAVLFDREQTSISTGTVNDDFIRNIIRVLGELRAGFGVLRPLAFCTVVVP